MLRRINHKSSFYVGQLRGKLVCNNSLSPFHKIAFQAVRQGEYSLKVEQQIPPPLMDTNVTKTPPFFWFVKRKPCVWRTKLKALAIQAPPHVEVLA